MRAALPAVLLLCLPSPAPLPAEEPEEEKPAESPFEIHPEKATLELDGRRLPALRAVPPRPGFRVQGLWIEPDGAAFRAFRGDSTEPAWTAKAEGADDIQVLEDTPARLLTRWWKKSGDDDWECLGGEGTLRPLSLADGKWGPALVLGEGENGGVGPDENVHWVEEGGSGTAVICTVRGGLPRLEAGILSYRVHFFPPGAKAPAWTVSRASAGAFPGHSWMRGDGGGYHRSDVRAISFLGDAIAVCAGPLQDILVLSAADGKERARLERAWEFRPGHPSPPSLPTAMPPRREESGRESEGKEDGGPRSRILAGPVVVPHRDVAELSDGAVDTFRVFVATAVDHHEIDGYALDGYLLELDASLRPVAMSAIPRLPSETLDIEGSPSADFRLEGGGILRATPSFQREIHGSKEMGTGHRVRIALLHDPAPVFREGFMTTGALDTFFADARGTLSTPAGGWVASKDAAEMVLPFEAFDFAGKGERRALLRIPIRGTPPNPETNYSVHYPGGDRSAARVDSKEPHLAVITRFRRTGDTLGVRVWTRGKGNLDLEFDVGGP